MITTSYPDYEGSYRGIFIQKLCYELKNQGIDVMVLTPRIFKQSPLFETDQGIKVHRFRFPSKDKPLNQLDSIPLLPMCIYMISGFLKALRIILKEKPDIIHGNWIVPTGLIAALAGLFTNTPVINTARGMDMRISEKGPVKSMFNLAAGLSKRLIVVSPAMKSRHVLRNAEVITSGVDEVFFDITSKHQSQTVLYARSLEPVYDAETLIKSIPYVIAKKSDADFIFAGSGSQETYLKNLAKQLGITGKIKFLGRISNEHVASLMKDAGVYVSTAKADGTSIALLEAMASGLVPVVTDIEANRPFISHGKDGYLFPPGDEKVLAECIIKALSREISNSDLENKRKEIKDTIYWNTIAKKYIAIYDQLA